MSRMFDALKSMNSPVARMIETEQRRQAQVAGAPAPPDGGAPAENQVFTIRGDRRAAGHPESPSTPQTHRVVRLDAGSSKHILPFDGVDKVTAERYRILRTNVLRAAAPHSAIGITSVSPGDGKTTTSINLAGALALKNELRVLLVDADLRRRGVALMLGIEQKPGLAEILAGECGPEEGIVAAGNLPGLFILPAGAPTSSPAELLDSAALAHLAADLREQFSYVVFDTTPVGVVADYSLVEKVCDHTMLVVRPDHTVRKPCFDALEKVQRDKFLGVVLNGIEEWPLWKSPDRYDYY